MNPLDFKNNIYFIKEIKNNEIILVEISKTYIRLYKSGIFNLNWLKSKVSEIYLKIK